MWGLIWLHASKVMECWPLARGAQSTWAPGVIGRSIRAEQVGFCFGSKHSLMKRSVEQVLLHRLSQMGQLWLWSSRWPGLAKQHNKLNKHVNIPNHSGLWVIPLEPFGLLWAARRFSRRVYVGGVIFHLDLDVTNNPICFVRSIQMLFWYSGQPQRAFSWVVFREPLTPFFWGSWQLGPNLPIIFHCW